MSPLVFLASFAQGGALPPEPGELHLRRMHQLTFGGQNAEAYFSASGRLLIFQRQGPADQCDQMYVMGADGSGTRRVSSGRGHTTRAGTCGRCTTTTSTPPTPTAPAYAA